MGLTRFQQSGIRLVNDNLSLAPRHFPQRVRAAEVVYVTVSQEDPLYVLDITA
jgi:hypothetical protein